jgi:hypothetical protein
VAPDDRARETQHPAGQPPARRRRKSLMVVPAVLLVLLEVGWIIAIGVFIYRTVT